VTLNDLPEADAAGAAVSQRRLERRVVLVTGGGSGAGAAIARHCAAQGASIVVADIDYALAGEVAGSIRAAGTAALAHRCDVAAEEQVIALVDRVAREFGGLDLVFNVAGPWLDDDVLGHWSRIVGTNLLGTMHVTRHAIELLKRRGGAIVNVASDSGLGFGAEERPAYVAAKAGVLRLTAALRSLQAQKIRVNCIAPDVITSPEDFAVAALNLALREECAGRIALYRTGKAVQLVDYGDPGYRQAHAAPW
jgi:meso-butanediol dehydrogenase / (S,S)-butanediol dehydrogenase / diacetyl reductase